MSTDQTHGRPEPAGGDLRRDAYAEGEQALALAAELRERVGRERASVQALKGHLIARGQAVEESQAAARSQGGAPPGEGVVLSPPGGLPLTVTASGSAPGPCLATVAGEVDVDAVPWLRQVLVDVVDSRPSSLSLQLSAVSFMDSAGLGALLHVRRWAQASGCAFDVVGVSPELHRLLRVTGLHAVLLPGEPA